MHLHMYRPTQHNKVQLHATDDNHHNPSILIIVLLMKALCQIDKANPLILLLAEQN